MPSSYTDSLRLEEQGTGENNNTWGEKLNGVLDLLDKSIAGHIAVAVSSGDVVLSAVNSAEDQARYKIVELTGTLVADVVVQVPEVSKDYIIWDSTTRGGFSVSMRLGAAGATTVVPETTVRGFAVVTDGTVWRPSSPSEATELLSGVIRLATTAEAQAGTSEALALSPARLQDVTATETRKGVLELCTDVEAQTGTDTERAITAANLQAVTATETRKGVARVATDAEAKVGTDNTTIITPLGLQGVTATEARKGVIEIATQTEVNTQTDATRAVVPLTLAGMTATTDRVGVLKLATTVEVAAGTDTTKAVTPARLAERLSLYPLKTDMASSIADGSFDPASPTAVWNGFATSVDDSVLSSAGSGFYVVYYSNAEESTFLDISTYRIGAHAAAVTQGPFFVSTNIVAFYYLDISASGLFQVFRRELNLSAGTASGLTARTINYIYKV